MADNRLLPQSIGAWRSIATWAVLFFALIFFFAWYWQSRKPNYETANNIDQYMTALVKFHRFSGTIMVARDGQPVLSRGYALANLEWDIPNRPNTKFRIGSITKQFTSMAIMMLQERGKLNVHDPICKYLPACSTDWRRITIHHLLTHTSGIPDFTNFPDADSVEKLPITPEALVDSFKSKPLHFLPGAKFEYSNSGYAVLGLIIERVSGQPYSTFLQHNIFDPLGMKSTGYDSNSEVIPNRASGYTSKGGVSINAEFIDMAVPYAAGGLYSTTQDLLLWDQALYSEKLATRPSLQAMFTPYVATVGYGWTIESQFQRKVIGHEGGIQGFVSKIARYPDDHVTIIVLSNLETAPITNISKDLAAIVFGEKYLVPQEQKIIFLQPSKLSAYVGDYQVKAAPDILIAISVQQGKLVSQVQGQSTVLLPESETTFTSDDSSTEVVFGANASGQITKLIFNGQFEATKLP